MGRLMEVLERYLVGDPELEDEMLWIWKEDGVFSIKSMYEEICLQKPEISLEICA